MKTIMLILFLSCNTSFADDDTPIFDTQTPNKLLGDKWTDHLKANENVWSYPMDFNPSQDNQSIDEIIPEDTSNQIEN